MSVGQVMLASLLVTGRVAVLLVYGVLCVALAIHLGRVEFGGRKALMRDRRSFWPALVSGLLIGAAPVCVGLHWGSLERALPLGLSAALAGIGSVVVFASLSFLGLAAHTLDRSAHVLARVDEGARLVREGPYRIVRHPIYFGMGMLLIGTALAGVSWPSAVAAALWWPISARRASLEEELLRRAYGAEYEAYTRSVARLFPVSRRQKARPS